MASENDNLRKAKKAKNDEFYTQLRDIENEMKHYREHFKGKTIYCNTDNPEFSNFWTFFFMNFDVLGLKKLVATYYSTTEPVYKTEYTGGGNNPVKTLLNGNGDFRSPECIEILKQADIVVTNPPFSLFREFVGQLMEYDKNFIVIGNQNAITYKEIFPLIKNNKLKPGYDFNKTFEFIMPDDYEIKGKGFTDENGKKHGYVPGISWFTTLDIEKRHEKLIIYKHYTPEAYPKYDNYDAINIDKVKDIPVDYTGIMGVPITFLDKYNPEQFEIIQLCAPHGKVPKGIPNEAACINGKWKYARILIKPIIDQEENCNEDKN